VGDLFQYRFAGTLEEVGDALGIGVDLAAAICGEIDESHIESASQAHSHQLLTLMPSANPAKELTRPG
jgi:hypothetical protein